MIIKIEKIKKVNDKRFIGSYLKANIELTGLELKKVFGEPYKHHGKDIIMYKANVCWYGFIAYNETSQKFPFTIYDYKPETNNYLESDYWSICSVDGIDKELINKLISYIYNMSI